MTKFFCTFSVIWLNFVRSFGAILFGRLAKIYLGTWRIFIWELGIIPKVGAILFRKLWNSKQNVRKTSYFASSNDYFLQKSCIIQIFFVSLQSQSFFAEYIHRRKRAPTYSVISQNLMI